MSEESDLKVPGAPHSPEEQQEAAMRTLKAIGHGEVAPPTNVEEAKAMVAASMQDQRARVAAVSPPGSSVGPAAKPAPIPPVIPENVPGSEKFKRVIGRLAKIEIENYRGFRGRFELELKEGCNLLVYGENGAGKSSLYHAIQDFIESPERLIKVKDNRHSYNATAATIRLSFLSPSTDGRTIVAKPYEWSTAKNDARVSEIRTLDKQKGFLDYKSLLRVHLLPTGEREINLFDIFINPLLAHYKNPVSTLGLTFRDEWKRITAAFQPRIRKPSDLDKRFDEFNAGFDRVVKDTVSLASELLTKFDSELAISVKFESSASYTWRPKNLIPPKILAEPSFRRLERRDYPRSLNEARLTALAIAIYLAGLKLLPATGFRLLVLDDILIGLDMMNRVKILDLIHEHFADWQILIFTYSKAWFERLREGIQEKGEFPGWGAPWESVTLWEEWRDGENSPRIVAEGSGDLLEMADRHLQKKDYTAAAVYARKALERLCHRICAKASLFVLHVEFPNERKVEHFLNALTPRLRELVDNARRAQALQLLSRLEQARAFVLNRNAHFDLEEEDTLSAEVGTAIEVMKDLTTFLTAQSWKKANFESGRTLTSLEQMNAEISAARKAAAKGAINQARLSLANAHNAFWRVFGLKLGVLVPIGEFPSARKFGNKPRFKIA